MPPSAAKEGKLEAFDLPRVTAASWQSLQTWEEAESSGPRPEVRES